MVVASGLYRMKYSARKARLVFGAVSESVLREAAAFNGLKNPSDLGRQELVERFARRRRVLDVSVILPFLAFAELRNIASALGISASGSRKVLVRSIEEALDPTTIVRDM